MLTQLPPDLGTAIGVSVMTSMIKMYRELYLVSEHENRCQILIGLRHQIFKMMIFA